MLTAGQNIDADIIVYCAAGYGEEIYLKLISMGYHVICFCDNAERNRGIHLLGLPVYNYQECRQRYPNAIYVIANSTYATAIEIGNRLEQDGFVKNYTYYISIELELQGLLSNEKEGIKKVLEGKILILFGNVFLCSVFEKWVQRNLKNVELHVCLTGDDIDGYRIQYPDAIWIPLERGISITNSKMNKVVVQILQSNGINSFSRFFLGHMEYCEELDFTYKKKDSITYGKAQIKKVLFLKSSSFSGSILIDSILDSHPNILYLDLSIWGTNIWYIIKNVVAVPKEHLVEAVISQIKEHGDDVSGWIEEYRELLVKYLGDGKNYSEKDLFIMLHLVYYELLHKSTPHGEMIIYMDIHWNVIMRNSIFSWLEGMGFEIILLEMVRNPYKRLGSGIKYTLGENGGIIFAGTFLNLLYECSGDRLDKEEQGYPVIRIRFEDLKLYPRQILGELCGRLGISWSDTLLETTLGGNTSTYFSNGDRITGFDLKPVYYSYDEYFDAFDKFRLDLIFGEKNRAYGYSFVDRNKYLLAFKELGSLFDLPFCIEKYISFIDESDRLRFRNKLKLLCMQLLYLEEEKDKYSKHFQFGSYLKIGEKK